MLTRESYTSTHADTKVSGKGCRKLMPSHALQASSNSDRGPVCLDLPEPIPSDWVAPVSEPLPLSEASMLLWSLACGAQTGTPPDTGMRPASVAKDIRPNFAKTVGLVHVGHASGRATGTRCASRARLMPTMSPSSFAVPLFSFSLSKSGLTMQHAWAPFT